MSPSSSERLPPYASTSSSGLVDGLGPRRLAFDREEGTMLERLVVRPELAAFEPLLRDRLDRLAALDDERIGRPRTLIRTPASGLIAVSEFVPGARLSEILEACDTDGARPGIEAALGFLLEVLPALCGLHAATGFAHGTIAPSRMVVTPAGQIVLLDAIYGGALSRLRFSRRRLWTELGLAVRPVSGAAALDTGSDIAQVALASVMLVLGRPLGLSDLVDGLASVRQDVDEVAQISSGDDLARRLGRFIDRALPFFDDPPFASADDALIEVRELAATLGGLDGCRSALHELVSRTTLGAEALTDTDLPAAAERDVLAVHDPAPAPEVLGRPDDERMAGDAIDELDGSDPTEDVQIDLEELIEDDEPYVLDGPLTIEQPLGFEDPVDLGTFSLPIVAGSWQPTHRETEDELHASEDDVLALINELRAPRAQSHEVAIAPADTTSEVASELPPAAMPDIVERVESSFDAETPIVDAEVVPTQGNEPPASAVHAAPVDHEEPAAAADEKAAAVLSDSPASDGTAGAEPGHQRLEPADPPAVDAETAPAIPNEVRARRTKKTRSARARKDKLRSARTAAPAAKPEEPEAAGKPLAGGWMVSPDRVPVFDPAPEPPAPAPHVVPFPVPVTPAPPRLPVHAAAPPPPVPLYAPVPAAAPFGVTASAAAPAPAPPYAAPWSAPLPQPVPPLAPPPRPAALPPPTPPALPTLGAIKLKTPAPAARRPRSEPVTDIYTTPVAKPLDDAPTRFPWRIAGAVIGVILIAVIAGRAYMPRSTPEEPPSAAAAIAAAAQAQPPFVPPAAPTGRLDVETQPAGARVLLNGKPAGETPLTIDAVPAGRHTVTLIAGSGSVRRTVRIEAGQTAKLDVPIFSGWIGIFAPFTVEVSKAGRVIGTTEEPRIMLGPGRHELTLTNRELGYRSVQTVDIEPGQVRTLTLNPTGTANLNATPWAEVWIDGQKVGDTPMANLKLPLGTREIVFRHPQLGERRTTVTIKASASAAISMDMTRPSPR